MSHITTIRDTQILNLDALKAACEALGVEEPKHGRHKLYGAQRAEGYAVKLKGWRYPVVVDTKSGNIMFDDYGSQHDAMPLVELHNEYALAVVKQVAIKQKRRIVSEERVNGKIVLKMRA